MTLTQIIDIIARIWLILTLFALAVYKGIQAVDAVVQLMKENKKTHK